MQKGQSIPWGKIYHVVLACGSTHEPRAFAIQTLLELKEICPFDQGLIFFVDGSGQIINQDAICQGGFHPKDEIPRQKRITFRKQ